MKQNQNHSQHQNSNDRPRRSLRSILTLWFLLFSIVPLAFVTGYSLVQFESAISEELHKRLKANAREMQIVMGDLESYLAGGATKHASDPALQGHLSSSNFQGARRLLSNWLVSYSATRVSVFDREGRLVVALYRASGGSVESKASLESGDVFLADSILKRLQTTPQFAVRDLRAKIGLELIVYTRVLSSRGHVIGYLEDIILIDQTFLSGINKRLNLDVVLMDQEARPMISTKEELLLLPKGYYREQLNNKNEAFFEITHRQMPYGFLVAPLRAGDTSLLLGLVASKGEIVNVTKGINKALFSVVGMIIILIVLTLFSASNMILKPLNQLVEAAEKIEKGEVGSQLNITNETELGLLMNSFNRMSVRLADARSALETKLGELERANQELQMTQAQLVQSAKMVSLGQLVAGVAHELNNPIGFIYSNMTHLKDYGDRLIRLVRIGQAQPEKLQQAMADEDFDYMDEDLPRLIRSCEDGARRVRDIVLGLRNFSRLDEIQIKEVNLEEEIRNTLQLLSGELKNRIQIETQFCGLPPVKCFSSQVNQVFMNILANAAQAIEGTGRIRVSTQKRGDMAIVTIEDNGKGIAREHLSQIFDPFFTTKPVGEGTGLGLSISFGIIQKHDGDIQVRSVVGQGTTFEIRLPLGGPKVGPAPS